MSSMDFRTILHAANSAFLLLRPSLLHLAIFSANLEDDGHRRQEDGILLHHLDVDLIAWLWKPFLELPFVVDVSGAATNGVHVRAEFPEHLSDEERLW